MVSPGLFTYSNLVHAVSGGCGSAVAMTAFYPLDTVRTRMQLRSQSSNKNVQNAETADVNRTMKDTFLAIMEQEGVAGLYRGLLPVIESLYCSNFVYFYAFHGLKRSFNPNKTAINDLLCGMAAGVVNVLSTTPLWVVNTRLKMQGTSQMASQDKRYRGMIDGLLRVYREEGVTGLWASCGSSLLLVGNPAIQFMVYESIKRHVYAKTGAAPSGLVVFLAGAVAKAIATTLTYPIQLAQARQRFGGSAQSRLGFLQLLYAIVKESGLHGLFRGLDAKLLHTVLTAALMFLCYEKIAQVVFVVLMRRRKTALARA